MLIGCYAKGGKFAYYVCGTLDKKGAGSCSAKYLGTKKFEGVIIEQIKKRVLTKENLKELVDLTNQALDVELLDLETMIFSLPIAWWLMLIAVIFTLVSGIDYFFAARRLLKEES